MNAERLYKVSSELVKDMDEHNIAQLFSNLNQHFSQVVSSPGQPQYQTNFINSKTALFEALEASYVNNFNTIDLQIIAGINGENLVGERLKDRIHNIIEQNGIGITPNVAYNKFKAVYDEFVQFKNSLKSLDELFGKLGIKEEPILQKGEAEVSFLLPRNIIKGDFTNFEKDIKFFRSFLDIVREVSGEEYRIEKIASSDFEFFICAGLNFALTVSNVLNPILEMFLNILKIRQVFNESQNIGIPEEKLGIFAEHEKELVEATIAKSQTALLNHIKDEHRKNEIQSTLIKTTLDTLVQKIDNGYQVVVSVSEDTEDNTENGTEESNDKIMGMQDISQLNKNTEKVCAALQKDGNILKLPAYSPEKKEAPKQKDKDASA